MYAKVVRDKPQGLIQPIAQPTSRWEHVSVDLTGRLPESNGFTAIAVVVDMFTKRVSLSATRHDVSARALAHNLFDTCFKTHGIPVRITSDRDTKFLSAFWQGLFQRMGSQLDMTTTAHPQADGQSERMIQSVKQYLTCFANYRQDTWADDLAMCEWSMNAHEHATIGMSPFYADTGREPRTPFQLGLLDPEAEGRVELVEQDIARFRQIDRDLKVVAARATAQQKAQADKHRRKAEVYQPGDSVMVTSEVFQRDTGEVGELAALRKKWAGPFKVLQRDERGNYELDLEGRHTYPVFHPEKLRRFMPTPAIFHSRDPVVPDPVVGSDGEEEWEVQDILDRRQRHGRWQYKVHWKGYPMERAEWLHEENLTHCQELLDDFNAMYRGATALKQATRDEDRSVADPSSKRQQRKRAWQGKRDYALRRRALATDGDEPVAAAAQSHDSEDDDAGH
jgi:hypothetical protein